MKTEYLLNEELKHVLAALTPSNQLVMRVCLHTGLRLGDVLRLRTAQLAPQFWITEQKTGKRRRVNLSAALIAELKLHSGGGEYVFPSRSGNGHRTRQSVWKDVKRASKAFRLPQNVAPHTMRKIYAVDLLERYGDIRRVQRALNHTNPSVTLIYAMADKLYLAKYGKKS